jgi:LmbE family N-acetylglucosaminyl deacetylase
VFPYARDRLAYPDLIKEGLMPHKVREMLLWGSEQPDYINDITDTYDIKMAALRCHKTQVGNLSPEWERRIKARYESAGKEKGFAVAEAFHRVEIPW